ncbi:hypothetical protein DSM107133_01531 [Pseudosulfitobacter sp. DSM 107133]|nr:hypothetical protein DSM107133_01531 [Pseudosulfitobacter sp. DSM 107133]
MNQRMKIWIGAGAVALAGIVAVLAPAAQAGTRQSAAAPDTAPVGGLNVYHLGHSLVGRDMPAMLAQFAPDGHSYHSQLGWGTPLRAHWEPDVEINGFDTENAHPAFRPARIAIGSGAFDAVVLTEMVEIEDAIRHHDSARYLEKWATLARSNNAGARVYLYETWHQLDDPKGWLERIDSDYAALWLGQVVQPAQGAGAVRIIPAGQVMAALVRRVEAAGGVGPMQTRHDLFRRNADGTQDMIHLNDLGNYLVALTHYAVLYHRTPVGLPYEMRRADGSAAVSVGPALAGMMQETVWQVVSTRPETGVAP